MSNKHIEYANNLAELSAQITAQTIRDVIVFGAEVFPDDVDPFELTSLTLRATWANVKRLDEVYAEQDSSEDAPLWLDELYGLCEELAREWIKMTGQEIKQ